MARETPCVWLRAAAVLCACVSLGVAAGGGVTGGGGATEWGGAVPRARCAARCLGLRIPQRTQQEASLLWCGKDKPCSQCLEPCLDPGDPATRDCHGFCEARFPRHGSECATSCVFLASVWRVKPGVCPAPGLAHGFAAACVESCSQDTECAGDRRCCGNGCGHTCQRPRAAHRGVPLRPRQALRIEEAAPGHVDVAWSSRFNVSMEPVVYVLQRRWEHGMQHGEDTGWDTVAQTTESRTRVSDVKPGRWYQFRVAAVNAHGTRGFTAPSRHFRSSQAPAAPGAPTNLRVTHAHTDATGYTRVTVTWDDPAEPDLPSSGFRVLWGPKGRPTRRTRTRANTLTLDGLAAGHVYTLHVHAEATWGRTRLRGARATLEITAPGSGGTEHVPPVSSRDAPAEAPPTRNKF